METPLERTPPLREAPAAPLEADSTLRGAVAGAGGVGVVVGGVGVGGSVLRLPENIDMKGDSFSC